MKPCPPDQCTQCWQHAYDKSIHRKLKPKQDCEPCLAHMRNPELCKAMRTPKKESIWW